MTERFQPHGYPLLIGSMPLDDHEAASRMVFEFTPDVPIWVQLPVYKNEGMVPQFLAGMPGLRSHEERFWVDTGADDFSDALTRFYESYLAVIEGEMSPDGAGFGLEPENAGGFFTLEKQLQGLPEMPMALKGQVTGPFTFTTGLPDQERQAIFYHTEARDAAVKMLAMKAAWQVSRLGAFGPPVIMFIDEPALAGFGSSEFISVSKEAVSICLGEVIDAIHDQKGLAGIHVCANTDWSLVLDSGADVINFDAYGYFDRFILYGDEIRRFIKKGGILAWGIVPTQSPESIDRESVDSLMQKWEERAGRIEALGFNREEVLACSFITPSCGVGSLSPQHARRVLMLTAALSKRVRGLSD